MIFTRQKIILALLAKGAHVCEPLRLVKLAFLLRNMLNQPSQSTFYSFVPYNYGPFSFGLYHDLNKLKEKDMVVQTDEGWSIGKAETAASLRPEDSLSLDKLFAKFDDWTTTDIVDHVYEEYPWFTARAKDLSRRRAVVPAASNAVYTSGYEEMQVDEFLNSLLHMGIKLVVDTRSNPVSRRYGFHKSTLSRLANNLGMEYAHFPEVGISSQLRGGLGTTVDYEDLFEVYRLTTLIEASETIAKVCELVQSCPTVLICSERCADHCHRTHLAHLVAVQTGLPHIELRT